MKRLEKIKRGLVKVLDLLDEKGGLTKDEAISIAEKTDLKEQSVRVNIIYVLVFLDILKPYSRTFKKWSMIDPVRGKISSVKDFDLFIGVMSKYVSNRGNKSFSLPSNIKVSDIFVFTSDEKDKQPLDLEQDLLCQLLDKNGVEKFDSFSGDMLAPETRISIFAEKNELNWDEDEDYDED
jgi:hypothetical protein